MVPSTRTRVRVQTHTRSQSVVQGAMSRDEQTRVSEEACGKVRHVYSHMERRFEARGACTAWVRRGASLAHGQAPPAGQ